MFEGARPWVTKPAMPCYCIGIVSCSSGPAVDLSAVGRHRGAVEAGREVLDDELVEFSGEIADERVVKSPEGVIAGIPVDSTLQKVAERDQTAGKSRTECHVGQGEDARAFWSLDLHVKVAISFDGYGTVPSPHEVAWICHPRRALEAREIVANVDGTA